MPTKVVQRDQWEETFDAFARKWLKDAPFGWVSIELVSGELGDQEVTKWRPLTGLSYDPKDDVATVETGDDYEHLIYHPQSIEVIEEADGWLSEVEIVDRDGNKHLIHLRQQAPEAEGALPE